jgi:hypothetical protein
MLAENVATPEGTEPGARKISLEQLSEMTGFPMELIQQELFTGVSSDDGVALEDLRAAMLSFIDSTLLQQDPK